MQLITNRIHTGKPVRFEDFIKKYQDEHQVKTASVDAEVKVAAEQEEADSSGQLDVEPLHQEGESTTMPKAGPSAKKEGVDGDKSAAADTDPEKEGKDSGQPKAEGSEKFTNNVKFDPNDIPKEEKGGSAEGETKEAGQLPEALEKHKFTKKDEEVEAKEEDKEEKKASAKKEDEDEEVEAKEEDKEEKKASAKKEDEEKEEKEAQCEPKKDEEKKETEAAQAPQFVKWANLDSKNKTFLTKYWRQLFGDDYVNALVADK